MYCGWVVLLGLSGVVGTVWWDCNLVALLGLGDSESVVLLGLGGVSGCGWWFRTPAAMSNFWVNMMNRRTSLLFPFLPTRKLPSRVC